MGRVFRRGSRWYIDVIDSDGRRHKASAAFTRAEALEVLRQVELGLRAAPEEATPALTLAQAAQAWHERRKARGLRTSANDHGYLIHHILPALGSRPVAELRVSEVRRWVEDLQAKQLAPRTVRHIYAALRKLYADLLVDEVVDRSPCVLGRDHLPPDVDADPEWRAQAVFSRAEVRELLTDPRIPPDRQVLYALLFYTGARLSEAIALRWEDVEHAAPLPRLLIRRQTGGRQTKTRAPRQVPIHPDLQRMLDLWRQEGAAALLGRTPAPTDLIVPSRKDGGERCHWSVSRRRVDDLARLDMRARRLHDARRTFITVAREGGARPDVLKTLTHRSRADVLDLYTSLPWSVLCEAVLCVSYE